MKLEFSRQIFEKNSDIKFNQNPSSGSGVVPCGQTDMKLIVAFRDFAKASKNSRPRPPEFLFFVHVTLSEATTITSLHSIHSMVSVAEMGSVYRAV